MHTTLLLHGGMLKLEDSRNDSYFERLVRGLHDGDEVLFIGFARIDEEDRKKQYEKEKKFLLAQTDKDIRVVNADKEDLIDQVKRAKSIQITGGKSDRLVETIRKYPEFLSAVRGKVIGGSSTGACLFSKHYYYAPANDVLEGLNILPIKMHVHNNNPEFGDRKVAVRKLSEADETLELITLDECEWIERHLD